MFSIDTILRDNIRSLKAYSCARDEYSGEDAVFLDANENPYDTGYNRYPDPYQRKLKQAIARIKGVESADLMLGNGSDEIIDLLIRSVCNPGVDNIIVFSPGYSMYEVSAGTNDVEVRKIDLTPEFLPDWDEMKKQIDTHTKIIFLCTPNNPTGTVIPMEQIEKVCREFNGIVLVDEAYIDFTEEASAIRLLETCPNAVVLQTLSKAWGMAGLRLGMCFASPQVIAVLNKVKSPYNISSLAQKTALELLEGYDVFLDRVARIKSERARLSEIFRRMPLFENVYASEANFILVTTKDFRNLYNYLVDNKVVVRLRDIPPLIRGGVRISVGTEQENDRLLELLAQYGG